MQPTYHAVVEPTKSTQLIVAARFDDPTLPHDVNHVGMADRRQPVRNRYDAATAPLAGEEVVDQTTLD